MVVNIYQINDFEGKPLKFKVSIHDSYRENNSRIDTLNTYDFSFSFLEDEVGADTLSWPYVIIRTQRQKIGKMISKRGEEGFRKIPESPQVVSTTMRTSHYKYHESDYAGEKAYRAALAFAIHEGGNREIIDRTRIKDKVFWHEGSSLAKKLA